jgi:hypothetical protein
MVFSPVEQLIKMAKNLLSKWPIISSQIEHLVKITNDS